IDVHAACLLGVGSAQVSSRTRDRSRLDCGLQQHRASTRRTSVRSVRLRSMAADELVVHGAREHNLKDVTVRLPRGALICITGLSGSGKSSLAFDTIYAEGQRRYVESLSAY